MTTNPLNIRFLRYIGPTTKHFINEKWRSIRSGSVMIADAADMNRENIPVATRGKGFGFDARRALLVPLPTAMIPKLTGGYSGQLWVGGAEAGRVRSALDAAKGRASFFAKEAQARAGRNPLRVNPKSNTRIVHNKLLGGWYVVRGPHQTPISGRFDTRAEAQMWLTGSWPGAPKWLNRRRNPAAYDAQSDAQIQAEFRGLRRNPDRFDVVEAAWVFAHDYGDYALITRLQRKYGFKPRLSLKDYDSLTPDGKLVYQSMVGGKRALNPLRVNPRAEGRDQLTSAEWGLLSRVARKAYRSDDGIIEARPSNTREVALMDSLESKGMLNSKRVYGRDDDVIWYKYALTARGWYNATGHSTPSGATTSG